MPAPRVSVVAMGTLVWCMASWCSQVRHWICKRSPSVRLRVPTIRATKSPLPASQIVGENRAPPPAPLKTNNDCQIKFELLHLRAGTDE